MLLHTMSNKQIYEGKKSYIENEYSRIFKGIGCKNRRKEIIH